MRSNCRTLSANCITTAGRIRSRWVRRPSLKVERSQLASSAKTSSGKVCSGAQPDTLKALLLEYFPDTLQTTHPDESDGTSGNSKPLRDLLVAERRIFEEKHPDQLPAARPALAECLPENLLPLR